MTAKEKRQEWERLKKEKEDAPSKCQEVNTEVIACKLYTFLVENDVIDKMMKQARQHPKLILDLRGNGGGYVSVEEYLTGYLFDHDVKIADMVRRDQTEERIAKSKRDKAYRGELIILTDSATASAAEVVARVVQIERRGKVVGDVSRGAVMTSVYVPFFGASSILSSYSVSFVGMNMTIGDVIMSDGSRLEHAGVVPDVAVGPTGLALARRLDPVLSHAANLFGADLTPEQAGKFYFITSKQEGDDSGGADN